jgi:hypothetical protein
LKDYYRILGVRPNATTADVKKAYRLLAIKYHPDKNDGSAFSRERFIEINEAYQVLSNTAKRNRYNDERWYAGIQQKHEDPLIITPEWLLSIAKKLNHSLLNMDIHRISHGALQQYILMILTEAHINLLNQSRDPHYSSEIINEILTACHTLDQKYLNAIEKKLLQVNTNQEQQKTVNKYFEHREKKALLTKMYPYLVIIVTLLLCLLMYFYTDSVK